VRGVVPEDFAMKINLEHEIVPWKGATKKRGDSNRAYAMGRRGNVELGHGCAQF